MANVNITDMPNGVKHKEMITDIDPMGTGTCLVPFVDLCNHKNSNDPKGKDKIDFMIIFRKGGVNLGFCKEFKKGEDYEYSYSPFSPNEKLLASYGFYIENNAQSMAATFFPIQKLHFPKVKHDLCTRLECFDAAFENFYADKNAHNANVQAFVNPHSINVRILNALRLYVLPNDKFIAEKAFERLSNKKWLSYTNEVMALSYYRGCLTYHFTQFKLSPVTLFYFIF
jgi:hypothetical protein